MAEVGFIYFLCHAYCLLLCGQTIKQLPPGKKNGNHAC